MLMHMLSVKLYIMFKKVVHHEKMVMNEAVNFTKMLMNNEKESCTWYDMVPD